MNEFIAYTFDRINPPGEHRELWYHSAGCHAWLVVTRNVSTHAILSVENARDVALARKSQTKDNS
jgi:sarcosine oxidase subunit delta